MVLSRVRIRDTPRARREVRATGPARFSRTATTHSSQKKCLPEHRGFRQAQEAIACGPAQAIRVVMKEPSASAALSGDPVASILSRGAAGAS